MEAQKIRSLIEEVARTVIQHAEELTELDQAIGDGDHGVNMKRGSEAVLAGLEAELGKPLPDILKYVGTTLVMKVGGASGPLYGTLFLTLGKEIVDSPTVADVSRSLSMAVEAVQKRGKSEAGQKTLLDVLFPVLEEFRAGDDDLSARVRQRAFAASEATIPMLATRGRASFLGERSIGHMDPGARSCALMIGKVCDVLGA
jgi:dihydroxyacetone kinase-like protein